MAGHRRPASHRFFFIVPALLSTALNNETVLRLPLPKLSWKGKLIPSDAEQRLAWGLYVELTTRIAVAGLAPSEGSLREALESYHTLFRFTRDRWN